MNDPIRIPVAKPDLSGNEELYVTDAIRSSWISSTGPYISRFEREFASLCGARASISVSNGTVALHLALLALAVEPGEEVIVPSLTYIATANAIRYVGGIPIFVDVDPGTWCIDPSLIRSAITSRTKGIIAVHLYGHPADMDPIMEIADEHGLWVIEDAAEAHLAKYRGATVGGLSTVGTFSFYGNKLLTSGEGGALVVNDPAIERRARLLRGQGMDPTQRYYFPVIGYNFRLTNVAAALLCAQLERAELMMAKRGVVYEHYAASLQGIPGLAMQPVASWAQPAPWLFSVTIDAVEYGRSRDELIAYLRAHGIDTRPFFVPIHLLPPYQRYAGSKDLPITERVAACGINLPTYSAMLREEVDEVARLIRTAKR
jgi:perosamine synthetase